MEKIFEPIRILWIDDCEAGYPESELNEELRQYFLILKHPDIPGPSTIRMPDDFKTYFPRFWGQGNTDLFPPEIIAMDYNLGKCRDTSTYSTDVIPDDWSFLAGNSSRDVVNDGQDFCTESTDTAQKGSDYKAGFEGLLLGIFTGSLLYQHPIGIVPMTYYSDLLESVTEVRALHLISKEILNIDYSKFGVSGSDRSWENVLKKGVAALRIRIENLYKTAQIILSPSDLMALAEDADHGVLTLRSMYAMRRLPVQGLFIDVPKENRNDAIKKWAKDLLKNIVDCEVLKQALELAGLVWAAYNNDILVEKRKRFSLLECQKEKGETIDQTEYKQLCEDFGVEKMNVKSGYVDIASTGNYSHRVRRWASLFITLNMLKKLILIRKKVDALRINDYADILPFGPALTVDDLFLALFPVPDGAIILPWHSGENILNTSKGWQATMLNWKTEDDKGKQRKKNLALHVGDLLHGKHWNVDKPHGLTDSERLVLQGFAVLDDRDLKEADWRACNNAKLVLWGSQWEVGYE